GELAARGRRRCRAAPRHRESSERALSGAGGFSLTPRNPFPIVIIRRVHPRMGSAPSAHVAHRREEIMAASKSLIRSTAAAALVLSAAVVGLQLAPAQGPTTFNEREVRSTGSLNDDPKSDVWTL